MKFEQVKTILLKNGFQMSSIENDICLKKDNLTVLQNLSVLKGIKYMGSLEKTETEDDILEIIKFWSNDWV